MTEEKMKIEKCIFSVIFLTGLIMFSILSAKSTGVSLIKTYQKMLSEFTEFKNNDGNVTVSDDSVDGEATSSLIKADSVEDILENSFLEFDQDIQDNVYGHYEFIEMYGTLNRMIGKKEINGFSYALDKDGAYDSVNFWNDVHDHDYRRYSQQLLLLKDETEEHNGHFIFLGFPNKYNDEWNSGYYGIPYNGYNWQMDELLLWNRRYGIDSIDYRETMKKSGLKFNELFYKTDNHWTVYAAFLAF